MSPLGFMGARTMRRSSVAATPTVAPAPPPPRRRRISASILRRSIVRTPSVGAAVTATNDTAVVVRRRYLGFPRTRIGPSKRNTNAPDGDVMIRRPSDINRIGPPGRVSVPLPPPPTPDKAGKKIALLFHVYDTHHQDAIWRRWLAMPGAEHFQLYVHAKHGRLQERSFLNDPSVTLVPTRPTRWAKTQLAKNTLLRVALKNPHIRHLQHLSDSCIPLFTPEHVYRRYMQLRDTESCIMYSSERNTPYRQQMFRSGRPVVNGLQRDKCHTHSEWITLSRTHASIVANWEHVPIGRAMLHAPCVDNENYPASVLDHAGRIREVSKRRMHHADWSRIRRYSGHPYSWVNMEVDDNLRRLNHLRKEHIMFVRKFPKHSNVGNYINDIWNL